MVRAWVVRVAAMVVVLLGPLAGGGGAGDPEFPPDLLNDPRVIELGRKVFHERCVFCHGKTAYPGKAPKLDPSRYTPDFVYDRVTRGFRGMPSFTHEFSEEQRRAVAAYVMSKEFSN